MRFRVVGPRRYECAACTGEGAPTWRHVEHRAGCPVVEVPGAGPLFDDAVVRGTARLARALLRERDGDPRDLAREAGGAS